MATLLDAHVPLPHALNLTAIGLRGTLQPGRTVPGGLGSGGDGQYLWLNALANAGFLDSLTCFVLLGGNQKTSCPMPLLAAADSFDARTSRRPLS